MSMSIIITGLEMPTERESFNLTIKYNGTVFDTETGMQVAEAHEIPPHGRLGDLDALAESVRTPGIFPPVVSSEVLAFLSNAPTIIPAEEGET